MDLKLISNIKCFAYIDKSNMIDQYKNLKRGEESKKLSEVINKISNTLFDLSTNSLEESELKKGLNVFSKNIHEESELKKGLDVFSKNIRVIAKSERSWVDRLLDFVHPKRESSQLFCQEIIRMEAEVNKLSKQLQGKIFKEQLEEFSSALKLRGTKDLTKEQLSKLLKLGDNPEFKQSVAEMMSKVNNPSFNSQIAGLQNLDAWKESKLPPQYIMTAFLLAARNLYSHDNITFGYLEEALKMDPTLAGINDFLNNLHGSFFPPSSIQHSAYANLKKIALSKDPEIQNAERKQYIYITTLVEDKEVQEEAAKMLKKFGNDNTTTPKEHWKKYAEELEKLKIKFNRKIKAEKNVNPPDDYIKNFALALYIAGRYAGISGTEYDTLNEKINSLVEECSGMDEASGWVALWEFALEFTRDASKETNGRAS